MSWDVGAWVINALNKTINALGTTVTTGGVPIVRKIQRGKGTIAADTTDASITLSGFTDVKKMIVIIDGQRNYKNTTTDYSKYASAVYLNALTKTKLTLSAYQNSANCSNPVDYSYQVIEFY